MTKFFKVLHRAPERWELWERVPSQFVVLAATFGWLAEIASEISAHQPKWAIGNGGCQPNWSKSPPKNALKTMLIGIISLKTIYIYIFNFSGDRTWQLLLVSSQPILDFLEPWSYMFWWHFQPIPLCKNLSQSILPTQKNELLEGLSKNDVEKWCPKLGQSDVQQLHPQMMSKRNVQTWHPKVTWSPVGC